MAVHNAFARLSNAAAVHRDPPFMPSTCPQTPSIGSLPRLSCNLQPLPYHWSSFAIGLGKLSATAEQFFFRGCSNGSKFVTVNSDDTWRFFYDRPGCLRRHKLPPPPPPTPPLFFFFFFLYPGWICLILRACLDSLISTESFRRALSASVDCCAKIKSAPSME